MKGEKGIALITLKLRVDRSKWSTFGLVRFTSPEKHSDIH